MHSDSSQLLTQLSLSDLELAINKARASLALNTADSEIHEDVAILAGLYGKMIYYKQLEVPMHLLSDNEQIVLLNWIINSDPV
jgi:Protein of unknown function (DUF3717)